MWLKKLKTLFHGHVISDFEGVEIVATFHRKELQKTNKKEFRVEKVIKRKGDKLYGKWKGYNSSFNIWIDKKDRINVWIFSRTKMLRRKFESCIRFV